MLLDFDGDRFEEIDEIYWGFPLKENFLEIGNAALAKYGVTAEYHDEAVGIIFVVRPYYPEEELERCRAEGFSPKDIARMKKSRFYARAVLLVSDPKKGLDGSAFHCIADGDGEFDGQEAFIRALTDEEWDQMFAMMEDFLNATVDCD